MSQRIETRVRLAAPILIRPQLPVCAAADLATGQQSQLPLPATIGQPLSTAHSMRKSRSAQFHRKYPELCRRRNVQPLPELRERQRSVLDFHCDRITLDDWSLILQALMGDAALVGLAIRARKACTHVLGTVDTEKKCRRLRSQPAFCAKYIFQPLVEIVASRLATTTVLAALQLEGLPLSGRYVQLLVGGLLHNRSVRYLSLARSNLGDDGADLVCTTLKHLPHVDRISLAGCYLSRRGAEAVAELLKYQKIVRFSEGWRQSLRYRDVVADQIPGLKYVSLNANADIGDEGLHALLAILVDDEWIKGVEMQHCGITDVGAQAIVECLNLNKSLLVFDVRKNAGIRVQSMNHIRRHLGLELEMEMDDGGGDGAETESSVANCGRMSAQARLAQSKERICSLEQQLANEVEQRKQAESLNEQLHQQMLEAQRSLPPSGCSPDAEGVESAPEFTIVSKEQLHSLLLEVSEHPAQGGPVGASAGDGAANSASSKSVVDETASTHGSRSVRKARSENLTGHNMNLTGFKTSKSECVIRDKERPKTPTMQFVEHRIGDYSSGTQPIHNQLTNANGDKREAKGRVQLAPSPGSFFANPGSDNGESDADSADDDIDVDDGFDGVFNQPAMVQDRFDDVFAYGDC